MPTTLRNTDILFNDGTTQSTAATTTSTDFGAVGTYAVLMMAANTNLATNGTIAGSSLRYDFSGSTVQYNQFSNYRSRYTTATYDGGGTSLSGTWRKVSTGNTYLLVQGCFNEYFWSVALYVRIS